MDFNELMSLVTTKKEFLTAVPTLIISETEMRAHVGDSNQKLRFEDLALYYFESLGFYGNRTRKNLYGYLSNFRELVDESPCWIEPQGPGAFFNYITCKTQKDWKPFWEWCFDHTFEELNEMRLTAQQAKKARRKEAMQKVGVEIPDDVQSLLDSYRNSDFNRIYALAHAFGEEKLLQTAEFLENRFGELHQALRGTPDLLIWRLEPKAFFFIEVKGLRDCLSDHQIKWIAEFKDKISDNIFILKIV